MEDHRKPIVLTLKDALIHQGGGGVPPVPGIVQRVLGPDEYLFNQNEPARYLYFIDSGYIRFFILSDDGRERTLRIIGPGELAGEEGFYLRGEYTGYAEAFEGPVVLYQLNRMGYEAIVRRWPAIYEDLLASLAKNNLELTQTIEIQSFQDLRSRVQAALIGTAGRYGRVGPAGVVIDVHLTHETIASMVGATRTRVSVCLSSLQHEGFYKIIDQRIVLSPWAVGLVPVP